MQFSVQLFESNKALWESYLKHPFLQELATGQLAHEKFQFYMLQDYYYLKEFLKVFAITLSKANEDNDIEYLTSGINLLFKEVKTVHLKYLEELGISETEIKQTNSSLWNTSYTNYMKAQAQEGTVLHGLVALLSCSWSYAYITHNLLKTYPDAANHEFYGRWLESYSAEDYKSSNHKLIVRIDQLGKDSSAQEKKRLIEIFTNCSEFEMKFWDMSYQFDMK